MVLADQGAAETIGDHFKNGSGSGGLKIHRRLHLILAEYLLLDARRVEVPLIMAKGSFLSLSRQMYNNREQALRLLPVAVQNHVPPFSSA